MAKCIYNGVELPELPSGYDGYPYATIVDFGNSYKLKLSDVPFFASPYDGGGCGLANYYSDKGIFYHDFKLIGDNWIDDWTYSLGKNQVTSGTSTGFIWTNYDMLDKEGNVYVKSSVFEGSSKVAILTGFQTGTIVRLMRGNHELIRD